MNPPVSKQAHHLARLILTTAQARGIALRQRHLRLERGLPVLRLRLGDRVLRGCHVGLPGDPQVADFGYAPDVITVHGSGERSSKAWPRRRDGRFNIEAVVDHLLHLVEVELAHAVPGLRVPAGVPASRSGLIVLHLAGVKLGVVEPGTKPEVLVENVKDAKIKNRIEGHLDRGGLTDGDLRHLVDANRFLLHRPRFRADDDPFELYSDHALPMLLVGQQNGEKIERRHVLVIDDQDDVITVADPAGAGLVKFTRDKLTAAWKLGAKKGVKWAGSIWTWR